MLYMMAHSLSRLAQGRRPVAISRMTHPSDHTSTAPKCPGFSPLITSGDMYIGVPVMDLLGLVAVRSPTSVRPCLAMTLAAPKSTYLLMLLCSSSISSRRLAETLGLDTQTDTRYFSVLGFALTFGLDVAVGDFEIVKVYQALEKL